ncbi:Cytochrome C oxidase subunit VIIc [Phanerochaete sordida]|uniref:Cytochrome c oxidase subunit 8, mitochondrial n=1 Tax=Phanerochaete sordida TaxID=48140 RepID=A0A9P3GGX8_9APHY|nr:Cytochrome C oxidase subunit VIIc [Phanerochaete sordida]
MSLLAKQAANTLRVVPRFTRAQHFDHAHPAHMPFGFGNKAAFRAKYLTFVGFGFALPFVAAYWQLRKASAAS